MRLIDADKLIEKINNFHIADARCVTVMNGVANLIKEQPTAYSVDKVVEELEKIRARETCDKEKCDTKELCRICVVDDAIEIVKQGGVSDDVCVWEKGSSGYVGFPAYYSKCCTTNSNGLEMQTHIIADWKYCPYCGKKILCKE